MKKAWILARKEWAEVFKNRFVMFTVAFLPILLTALPLVILRSVASGADPTGFSAGDLPPTFAQLCSGMTAVECGQYYLVTQFLLLFMLMPLAIPITFASYSIVGEKTTRTLEPLLATPISTLELLAGKAMAATIPAIVATWSGFAVFSLGVRLLSLGDGVARRLADPLWLLAIFVVGPLLALAAVSVAMMVSSRVNDPRVSEQLSMLVILPLLAIFFAQIAGFFVLNQTLILWAALVLAVIDAGLIAFAIQLFRRETILTRWK